MQRKTKQALALIAIVAMFMQTLFGSLPVMATGNLSTLHITMTTNGQPYNEGDTATSPVEVQVATTSGDSAGIEISQDARTTWQPFDHTEPLVITEEGEHELWFRLADVEERRIIKIGSQLVQPLQLMKTTTADSTIIYVTENGGGNKDGTNWENAFGDLQSALVEASSKLNAGATSVQIWLAAGIYTPTKEAGGTGNHYKTFQMQNNVGIYGGFNGTESHLEARNLVNNKTILSGDIANTPNDNTDNAYHVFYHPNGLNLDTTAILDGVTITGGNANGSWPHDYGGGMLNDYYSSPTLTDVTFEGNTAYRGGGMYNAYSSPTLTDVTFVDNTAIGILFEQGGGGMVNWASSPTLTNVTFERNTATGDGGGMLNESSSPTLTNVTFEGNTADRGGGMVNAYSSSSPTLTNVTFEGNTTTGDGGGMFNTYSSSPTLTDVTFEGNTAATGGGMSNWNNSSPTLTNVTMSGNQSTSSNKGAIYDGTPNIRNSIRNSIIAGNNGEPALHTSSGATIENSLLDVVVEDGQMLAKFHQSATDIQPDTYPPAAIFIDPSQYDYRLRAGSPAINTGENTRNTQENDLAGNPRIQGGVIDLGAYESEFAYHMVYEANGATGDGPIDKMTYKQGDTITIQNRGNLTRTGYTFAGWNTQADGQGNSYAENGTFIMGTSNQILYAQWTANPYKVIFESNGGSDVAEQPVLYNEKAIEPLVPSKQGHTFVGWYTDGNDKWDFAIDVVMEDITLYAQWTENPTYTVTYDSNGATGGDIPEDTQRYEENTSVTVQGNSGNLERTGYTFVGWNTQVDGQGDSYVENDAFIMGTSNQILYAKWIPNTYTVIFESNGGSDVAEQPVLYNEKAIEPLVPSKQGHTFVGWYTDGNDKWDFAIDVVMEDITLYAQWTANPTYTVTYDSNGATDGMVPHDNQVYEEKAQVTVQGNSGNLTRTGYTFVGWNTQADGKGKSYTEKATFQMGTTHITLYAQWTVNPNPPPTNGGSNVSNDNNDSPPAKVKITLHTNGGTAIAPIDIAYNTKISDLPVPIREGYRFDGWYQDEELTKPWVADTVLRENISLYAKWAALPVEEPQPQPEPEAPSPSVTFSDIERHWAKDMIEELTAQGIIQGYEDGTFRPNEAISRMHVAALLTRAFSFEQVRETDDFKDVSPTHPYYEAIMTLQQAGIVDGTNGAFLPAEKMTRAQLAKVLVGLMNRTPEGISSFADVDQKHWSVGYIAVLEQEGIALGDNGKFNPNAPVTRAQFVTFLYRVMQTIDS